jgi:cation:H+ antiporter
MAGFTKRDRVQIAILFVTLVPFVATVLLGYARGDAVLVATATGLAIASSGFALAWGTESLQFFVSQVMALAVLALVQVVPEYTVEVVLAYRGATDQAILQYATAAMTGANRLLLGLGWPVVFLLSYLASKRLGPAPDELELEAEQSVEIFFLGMATMYSFVVVVKGTLGVEDAAVLLGIFAAYLYMAKRMPPHGQERIDELGGASVPFPDFIAVREYGHMLPAFESKELCRGYPFRKRLAMLGKRHQTIFRAMDDQNRIGGQDRASQETQQSSIRWQGAGLRPWV